jgi:DNA ligase-4
VKKKYREHTKLSSYDMMQPTPAPSPSRKAEPELEKPTYPHPPENIGSAPFGVLVGLFHKLQNERKQDRRRKWIDAWFTVCPRLFICNLTA